MGFLTRLFIPRKVRRVAHPGRAVKRAVTPRSLKRARRAMHPISNATYSLERSLNTKRRRTASKGVYRHGSCQVKHRSAQAANNCRHS